MSLNELTHAAAPWGRSALTALLVFVALWFDPRITYMQRDIADNRAYTANVDNNGTRKSQEEYASINRTIGDHERRLSALEEQGKHIDQTLTAILSKLDTRK